MRAERGHRVSARRENNATTWFRIVAGTDGTVKIRDNFGGRTPKWSRSGVVKVGDNFELSMKRGQSLEATLPKPNEIPPAPANAAEPVVIRQASAITPNKFPLRIGANSQGGNCFIGQIARPAVFSRVLSAEEVGRLATRGSGPAFVPPGCAVMLEQRDGGVLVSLGSQQVVAKPVGELHASPLSDELARHAIALSGQSFVEIPHGKTIDCADGVTIAAWILPSQLPFGGMRIIDKSPVGAATGYMLDTYPGNSLRLISREPHLSFAANLPTNQWSHVAATVDGATGRQVLYLNGEPVAKSE